METKFCKRCEITKPLAGFNKNRAMKDGYSFYCRKCQNRYDKEYADSNRGKLREHYRRWYRENKKKVGENSKRWAQNNRGKVGVWSKQWRERNREKCKAHAMVQKALRSGALKKSGCEVCGIEKLVHGHHEDYSKPLDVNWLCPQHHKDIEANKEA